MRRWHLEPAVHASRSARASVLGGTVLSALMIAACGTHYTYPVKWPAIPAAPPRTCDQIAGVYRDSGELFYSATISLTELIFGKVFTPGIPVDPLVTLSFPESSKIQIMASTSNMMPFTRVLTSTCKHGTVTIGGKGFWSGGSNGPMFGVARTFVKLELYATDRYLVMKRRHNRLAFFEGVLPLRYQQSDWVRFERYEPPLN